MINQLSLSVEIGIGQHRLSQMIFSFEYLKLSHCNIYVKNK